MIFLCLAHHFHCPSNDVGCDTRCLAGHDLTVDASAAIRILQYCAITTILPAVTLLLEGGYPAQGLPCPGPCPRACETWQEGKDEREAGMLADCCLQHHM